MMQDEYRMEIHSHSHNFETSSILILIVTLGKYIEIFSKMKTINKLQELAELKVTKANLISVGISSTLFRLNNNFLDSFVNL